MSDTEGGLPSEATISQKLRDVVISIHKTGKDEDLTIKRIRARAEKELSLPDGFLKKDVTWKQKSQDTISDAVDKYCKEATPEPSPKPVKKTKAKAEPKGVKRKAAPPAKKSKKRRKTDSDDDLDDDLSESPVDEPSEAESEPPKKKKLVQRGKKPVVEESDEEASPQKPTKKAKKPVVDESDDEAATPVKKPATTPPPESKGDVSESELSELIDESPKRKSKKKEPATKAKKGAKPAAPKAKSAAKPKAADDPDTAEVKRLQGWLVKCGIRKVWSRDPELSKCDTSKEKIRVLKGMLSDVGMDGKYSVEKAAKIKEDREFAKDLAAIQETEAHWGTGGETAGGRPKRRAAAAAAVKPQQKIEFSDDSENEEEEQDQESSDDNDDDDAEDDVEGGSGDDDDKAESMDEDSE